MRRSIGAVLLALAALAACSDPPGDEEPQLTWSKVDLPVAGEPVTLTAGGSDLLIGLRATSATTPPALVIRKPDGRISSVPVRQAGMYEYPTSWYSIAADGDRLLAISGAHGGAHANVRWMVWTGTKAGLVERPQPFSTFGGYGAGELFAAALTPAGSAVLGSWAGKAGHDAAVWLPTGDRWLRQPSSGVLESTAGLQVGPRSGTSVGTSVVLAGSVIKLAPGVVKQQAAVWRSASVNQGWRRLDLPDAGERSEAVAANCTVRRCLVNGFADGKLALWSVEGTKASRLNDVPDIDVQDKDDIPAPLEIDGQVVQVVADDGRVKVLRNRDTGWVVEDSVGPQVPATQVALVGNEVYVVAHGLWRVGF